MSQQSEIDGSSGLQELGVAERPTTQSAGQEPYPARWQLLPVLLAAMFMAQFDLNAVNVATASIQRDLHAGQAALELIVAGYGFTYASGLITGGRLGDLFGNRRMFLVGALAFTVASALCGAAQSPNQLIIARLLQGLTGAAMVPQVLAQVTSVFPAPERPRALSWFGVTVGLGAVAGQVLGGTLLDLDLFGLGWRVIFLVNVPIGVIAASAAYRLIPRKPAGTRTALDPLGAIGISLSLGLLLVPLVLGRTESWPVWTWACVALSIPVAVITLTWETRLNRRGGQPMLQLSLFEDSIFNRGVVVGLGLFGGFYSLMFVLALVLQFGLGLSPLRAGLTFGPLGLAFAVASILAPRFAPRYGARLITVGSTIAAIGAVTLYAALQISSQDVTVGRLIAPMILIGLGNGVAVPVTIGAVLSGAHPRHAGAAAGVLTTTQQFSGAAGVAVLGTIFFTLLGSGSSLPDYASAGAGVVLIVFALILIAGLCSLLLPSPAQIRARTAITNG
jgi:EmrB/QacA subfamily drug resistance transporter